MAEDLVKAEFWSKVNKDTGTQCWLWTGRTIRNGRGIMIISGHTHTAPRVSWYIHHSVWPGDRFVCHTCDVPACVNPLHLFLGTAKDNAIDLAKKGRSPLALNPSASFFAKPESNAYRPRGDKHGRAKLAESQVDEIRRSILKGESQRKIASRYGVTQSLISRINRGVIWQQD
jgi:hypothetical protein